MREAGKSIRQVAQDLAINPGTLAHWVTKDKIAREEKIDPRHLDPSGLSGSGQAART
ncbi:MAG TPA: hypothetical protein VK428_13190 [Acidimicrobiales bacterium]|nr:hypothetical protein [Acidimicrobiales bacterium]